MPRGVADKAVADRNLPIRFYLPHCAPVFSPAPFLSVSYPFFRCLCPSLRSGLGRVKILAWGRPAGRFTPGDTRRYIFPSVTMHRTSSKQRVWSIHQPVNIYMCVCMYMCVSHQSRSCTRRRVYRPTSARPARRKRYRGDTVLLATNCGSITYSLRTCE